MEEGQSQKDEKLCMAKADEQKCLTILPEVVWTLILNKLSKKSNPDHIQNYVNSSPYFSQLAHPQKMIILFPSVISVLACHFEDKEYVPVPTPIPKPEVETKCSWRNSVLNSRLVCLSWNKAVENLYQSPSMTGIPEYLQNDNLDPLKSRLLAVKSLPWTRHVYNFWDIEKCQKMLVHFQQSHLSKCPFLGRSIVIQVYLYGPSGEQRQQYLNLISQLLKLWGSYIWYCDIWLSCYCFRNSTELYLKLREWLNRLPNLKCLRILDQGDGIGVSRISERKIIKRKLFPRLKDLEILEVKYLASQIVNELLNRNGHLKVLKLCRIDDNAVEEGVVFDGSQLTNLKEFSVVNSVSGCKMMEDFGHLWKLETVNLEGIPIKCSRIFGDILCNNWGDSLIDLYLGEPFGGNSDLIFEQSRDLKLAGLSKLKKLRLDVGRESIFLNFLLPLIDLEVLEMKMLNPDRYPGAYRDKVREDQTIEWVGFENNMQMSYIWGHFKKLKVIVIEYTSYPYLTNVYLRDGFKKMVFMERSRWELNQNQS